ncbi:uncharacterized protein LOC133201881 [Saccostrea echinata]|uniref:uncharacterized protein LOC133201881 n=1 Tax=Saccostrea echinata TaxID=191078 RepID=UPI002A8293DB|nr:uncharacterized protein LOC133201881 [Saccostrea echinata]
MEYIQAFNWQVIEKLGNEILRFVFGRRFNRKELGNVLLDPNAKCKSEAIKAHLYSYFESYIFGMLWGIAGNQRSRLLNGNINSTIWRENNKRAVINDVRRGSISVEILNEIRRLASFIDVLHKWKLEIENIMKTNPLKDEIPFEAQISLSRIPGVKAFGISNKTFTVSIDEEKFKNNNQMVKVVKEAVGKLFPVESSTLKPWKQPIFHVKCGESIKGVQTGKITMFTELYGSDKILDHLYFLTCKHVASDPKTEVYMHCMQCKTHACTCEKSALGVNMYPFGPEKKNIFGAYIDFTCGLVAKTIAPECDRNLRNKYHKLIEISSASDSTEDHVGQKILKWTDSTVKIGEYDGVQYLEVRENDGFRRVDIIRSTQISFGGPGESGCLLYLLSERTDASDIITPMFVYCGQWEENKYMCFRFREGLDCLASEYVLNFRLCYENPKDRPSMYISSPRKRKNNTPLRNT